MTREVAPTDGDRRNELLPERPHSFGRKIGALNDCLIGVHALLVGADDRLERGSAPLVAHPVRVKELRYGVRVSFGPGLSTARRHKQAEWPYVPPLSRRPTRGV